VQYLRSCSLLEWLLCLSFSLPLLSLVLYENFGGHQTQELEPSEYSPVFSISLFCDIPGLDWCFMCADVLDKLGCIIYLIISIVSIAYMHYIYYIMLYTQINYYWIILTHLNPHS
jgi:hypothetical protein